VQDIVARFRVITHFGGVQLCSVALRLVPNNSVLVVLAAP